MHIDKVITLILHFAASHNLSFINTGFPSHAFRINILSKSRILSNISQQHFNIIIIPPYYVVPGWPGWGGEGGGGDDCGGEEGAAEEKVVVIVMKILLLCF